MNRRRRPAALVLASWVALVGLAVAACSDDTKDAAPSPRRSDLTTTSMIDYSAVPIGSVKGVTTTTVVATGSASILGTVSGPGGPIGGATVRIERLVRGTPIRTDVLSGPDGHYELRNIPGGRYRVRGFLAPALAQVDPQVQFLSDRAEHTIDVALADQRGVVARADAAPDVPFLDEAVNIAVVVASRVVDADGVVRSNPVVGVRVELDGLGRWTLRSSSTRPPFQTPGRGTTTTTFAPPVSAVAYTDGAGQVRFELTCVSPGAPGLSLLVPVTVTPSTVPGEAPPLPVQQVQSIALSLPECVDPATLTPTTVDDGFVTVTDPPSR
jgi:hypothetical protein